MLPARALLALSLCVWGTSCTGGGERQDLPDAVAGLVADLDSRNPAVRLEAVATLSDLGAEAGPAAPALIGMLTDPDAEVRMATTTALGDIGTPAVSALIEALGDNNTVVRRGAAYALGKKGPPAQPAVPALVEMLEGEPDGRARAYVIWSLSKIGLPAEEAKPILEKACIDPEPVVRRTALEARIPLSSQQCSPFWARLPWLPACCPPGELPGSTRFKSSTRSRKTRNRQEIEA